MADSTIEILIKARDQTKGALKALNTEITKIGANDGLDEVARDSKKATKELNKLGDAGKEASKGLSLLKVISFAALAAGVAKMTANFLEFNKAIAEVSTLVDSTVTSNEELEETVLDLSAAYGQDASATAKALYQAISAGAQSGAEANKLLETAIEAAIGGVTTAEIAVDGLTSVISAYGLGMDAAEDVSDSLFTTVKGGKTTFDQLSKALAQVSPIASAAGVAFTDVNAAVATLTLGGTQTAVATTQIRSAIQGILRPTKELTEVFAEYGGAQALLAQDNGLQIAFTKLKDATGGSIGELQKLVGSVEGVNAVLGLTGRNTDNFNKALADQAERAGASSEAFEKVNSEISQKFSVSIAKLERGFLKLSAALEPALALVVELGAAVGDLIADFADSASGPIADFFEELNPVLDELVEEFKILGGVIADVFGEFEGGSLIVDALKLAVQGLGLVFRTAAFAIAGLRDGIKVLEAILLDLTSTLAGVAFAFALVWPDNDDNIDKIAAFGKEAKAASEAIFKGFEEGNTATQRLLTSLDEAGKSAETLKKEVKPDINQVNEFADAWEKPKEEIEETVKAATALTFSLKNLAAQAKALAAQELAALQDQLDDNLISYENYYEQRAAIQKRSLDAEIAIQQQAREQADAVGDVKKLADAETALIILRQQRARIGVQASRDEAEATESLADELKAVELLLAEKQNGGVIPLELQVEDIEAQYSDLLDRLEAEGDLRGQKIVKNLIAAETLDAELDVVEGRFNTAFDNFENKSALLTSQADAGLITQAQAISELATLREQTLPALEAERDILAEIAERTGDPEAIARLTTVQEKINSLNEDTIDWAKTIEGVVVDGFGDAFASIIDGTKSAGDAFKDFARDAVAEIGKIAAQQLILNALKSFGGGFSGGGSVGGLGFASGGRISGPGGPTGDKIPIMASNGEFMMRTAAVNKYGTGFMHAINRGLLEMPKINMPSVKLPKARRHFAEGGVISTGANKDTEGGSSSSLRIVNVVDTNQSADYLASADGEAMIVNIIRRNGSSVKSLLR